MLTGTFLGLAAALAALVWAMRQPRQPPDPRLQQFIFVATAVILVAMIVLGVIVIWNAIDLQVKG